MPKSTQRRNKEHGDGSSSQKGYYGFQGSHIQEDFLRNKAVNSSRNSKKHKRGNNKRSEISSRMDYDY